MFRFKMKNSMRFGISAGYVQPEGGTAPEYVKAKVDALYGSNAVSGYEAGDISDECEIFYRTSMSGPITIKPRKECLLVLAMYIRSIQDYEDNYNELIQQGWEYKKSELLGGSATNKDRIFVIFTRKNHGGTVNVPRFYSQPDVTGIMAIYGAKSIDVVKSGNLPITKQYSYNLNENTERALYGFKTAEPTNKKRLYLVSACVYFSSSSRICSNSGDLSVGEPPEYIFAASQGEYGFRETVINLDYDNTVNNSGLVWFTEYKDNPPENFEPSVGSYAFASFVLDINY